MKKIVCGLVMAVVLFSMPVFAGPKEERAMLQLKAEALYEKIMRIRVEMKELIRQHDEAAHQYNAIIQYLEAEKKKENKS